MRVGQEPARLYNNYNESMQKEKGHLLAAEESHVADDVPRGDEAVSTIVPGKICQRADSVDNRVQRNSVADNIPRGD